MDGGPLGPWIVSPAPAVAQVGFTTVLASLLFSSLAVHFLPSYNHSPKSSFTDQKKKVGEDSYHNIVTEETVSGDSFRFMQKQLDEGKSAKEAYEAMVKADEDALADVGAATSKDGES